MSIESEDSRRPWLPPLGALSIPQRRLPSPGRAAIIDVTESAQDLHHILTDVLGKAGGASPRIDIERCGLLDSDVVLLCTNGLTDVADEARIANTLRLHHTPNDQCLALVDLAVNSGSRDDVTAVVARYRIPG